MGGLADPATSGDFHEEERSHLHGIVRKSESTRLAGTWVVPLKARVVVRIYHGRNIINPPLRLIKYDFGNSIEHLKKVFAERICDALLCEQIRKFRTLKRATHHLSRP